MEYVLETSALTKRYRGFTALDSLTMRVPKGAIYGFVGRNGAGKTTLIRLICGLQEPTGGSFTLYGVRNTDARICRSRRRMGAVVETPSVYTDMTAEENLRQQYLVLGMPSTEGIPELLRDLKASGVRIAVATGKPTVFSEQILEHFGLRQYIDVVSGIPLDREPPDKCEVILHALYEMGISGRSGCVMVGDRSHDAIGAKMARIGFIGVLYGYGSREELEAEGTDAIADSVAALRSLLFS